MVESAVCHEVIDDKVFALPESDILFLLLLCFVSFEMGEPRLDGKMLQMPS